MCRVVTHLKNNDSDSADTTCIVLVLYCSFIIFHIQSPYYVYICLETSVQQEDCRPPFSDATTGFGFALSFTFTFTMNPLPWFLFLVVELCLLEKRWMEYWENLEIVENGPTHEFSRESGFVHKFPLQLAQQFPHKNPATNL